MWEFSDVGCVYALQERFPCRMMTACVSLIPDLGTSIWMELSAAVELLLTGGGLSRLFYAHIRKSITLKTKQTKKKHLEILLYVFVIKLKVQWINK